MKKQDIIILILALLLLTGMVLTLLFGGEKSRHGIGSLDDESLIGFSGITCSAQVCENTLGSNMAQ